MTKAKGTILVVHSTKVIAWHTYYGLCMFHYLKCNNTIYPTFQMWYHHTCISQKHWYSCRHKFYLKCNKGLRTIFKGVADFSSAERASVAAKFVKTATKILFAIFQTYIRVKINRAGKFGPFYWIFVHSLKWPPNILPRENKSGRQIWPFFVGFSYAL